MASRMPQVDLARDIDACIRQLRDTGLTMLEPQSFSRPVTIDGVEHLARFRTVRTAPELFEAGDRKSVV